ncbi:MAG: hypothetical protein CNCCGFBP_01256 [Fimbriimonadaceae bacterium]|nr:hypothetical protein [Fimbriimonadaceae bacterium]
MNWAALAQASPLWSDEHGSNSLWVKIVIATLLGFALIFAFMKAPTRARRPIVAIFTFVAGAFWVLVYLFPQPVARSDNDVPSGLLDGVSFFLSDAVVVVGGFSNILTAFILGLGVYSLARIHIRKFIKRQKDWVFSGFLLLSMLSMTGVGYWKFVESTRPDAVTGDLNTTAKVLQDYMFDGLLQQMEAVMFSLIAFFILSAAYRAFRVRSIEATILLASAVIIMLSLMGGAVFLWDGRIDAMTGQNPDAFLNNFKLSEVAGWLRNNVERPGLRAIDFGIGLGALAMGLRLWLSLERTGMSN